MGEKGDSLLFGVKTDVVLARHGAGKPGLYI
jgi:hypothetical protein